MGGMYSATVTLKNSSKHREKSQQRFKVRIQPNSVERGQVSERLKQLAPSLPAYGAKEKDVNKVANYLNQLDTRLS